MWVEGEMRGGLCPYSTVTAHRTQVAHPGIPALVQSLLQCGCDKMVSFHVLPLMVGCFERACLGVSELLVYPSLALLGLWGAQSLGHLLVLTQRLLSRRGCLCESPYLR